jgi:hypothetical protein
MGKQTGINIDLIQDIRNRRLGVINFFGKSS